MRLAAYCRVSTDHEDQLDSLKKQKEFFEEYAKLHGHELVNIYADEGISGKQLKKRQQFLKMLDDAELGLFDIVAVKDVARFARNTVDLLTSIRELKRKNITTEFVTNNMTSLGDSEFVLTMFAAIAQEESANLSKRVRFGKKINAQKGRVPNRVYGYRHKDIFNLEIIEEEAAVVRRIYRLVLEGKGFRKIATILNTENVPTKLGGLWAERSIRRMVSYPIYMGLVVNNRTETDNFLEGTRQDIPEEEWYVHERPEYAIVSREVFEATQKELERRKHVRKHDMVNCVDRRECGTHLFSGLIVCATCKGGYSRKATKRKDGLRLYWKCYHQDQKKVTRSGPFRGQICDNSWAIEDDALKDCVEQCLRSMISDKGKFVESIIEECSQNGAEAEQRLAEEIAALRTQIERHKNKKNKLMDLYAIDALTLEEVKVEMEKINRLITDAESELATKELVAEKREEDTEKADHIAELIERCLSLELLKNSDLKQIIEKIVAYPERKLEIKFRTLELTKTLIPVDTRRKKERIYR